MAVSVVEGIQSQGVIATVKHFAANNMEYGRLDHSSDVDERTLREIYLPAFEASVKEAKAGAVMDAYNLVNGVYMTQNNFLNRVVLKKEWGFDGILMSDWGATHDGIAARERGSRSGDALRGVHEQAHVPACHSERTGSSCCD